MRNLVLLPRLGSTLRSTSLLPILRTNDRRVQRKWRRKYRVSSPPQKTSDFESRLIASLNSGGTNPAFTFLTGHGGYLQTLTHGFTGFRSRLDRMYLDPLLPPQLEDYTLKGFKWGGASFDIHLTSENTTITRKESSDNSSSSIKIEVGSRNEKAGN